VDTFTELRQLAEDLTELGDTATAALVRQALDRFMARKFEAGEVLLKRALEERRKHEHGSRRRWAPVGVKRGELTLRQTRYDDGAWRSRSG
jgi:hypothetical protein